MEGLLATSRRLRLPQSKEMGESMAVDYLLICC